MTAPPTATGSPPVASGIGRRLTDVYVQPARIMEEVATATRTAWWAPVLVVIAATLALTGVLIRRMDLFAVYESALRASEAGAKMTADEIERIVELQVRFAPLLMLVAAPLGVLGAVLWRAVALHFGLRVLAGGRGGFGRTFAVTAWAYSVEAFNALASIPVLLARPPLVRPPTGSILKSNVGAFVPQGAIPEPLRASLMVVDLFNAWFAAIVVIGLARVHGASRASAAAVCVLMFVVTGLGTALMTALSG